MIQRKKIRYSLLLVIISIVILAIPGSGLDTSPPDAGFSMNVSSGAPPLSVQFLDGSMGNNLSYLWNFGDGSTDTSINPLHIYTAEGIFQVTLTVSNEAGTDSISHQLEVVRNSALNPPVSNFSVSITEGSFPLPVQFTDQSTGDILTYQWNFGDGSVSEIPNPNHVYGSPGNFTVSLNVSNAAGSDIYQAVIRVTDADFTQNTGSPPVAGFLANRTEGEIPLPILFSDISTGPVSDYYWEFGDNATSTEKNPVHLYITPGTYTVHLFVNGTLGSSWENKTAYINATGIRASFSGDPTIGKAPLTVQFTDESSEDNLSYFWEFGDGNTSEEIDPQHTYAEPGRYNVSLRINSSVNLPFWENRTEYIRVYSFEPEVEFDVDPSDGYAPLTVSFIDLSPIEGIITWEWDFGDGYRGIGETSAHTFSEAGKYSVMLNVSTENDTFSTMKRNIVTVLEDTEDTTHTVAPKPVKTTMVTIPAATPTPTIAPVSSSSIALYTLNFTGIELRTLDDGNQQVALSRSVLETEGIQVGEDADQLTLSYPTYQLILHTINRTDQRDVIHIVIDSIRMKSTLISGPFYHGNLSAYFDTELVTIANNSRISGSLFLTPPASLQVKFQKAAETKNLNISDIAGAVRYDRTNLTTNDSVIVIGVPSSWVDQHGGKEAIRIARVSDQGTSTLLDTQLFAQKEGHSYFEALSPDGLSWFGMISVSQNNVTSTEDGSRDFLGFLGSFSSYLLEKGVYLMLMALIATGIVAILLYLRRLNA